MQSERSNSFRWETSHIQLHLCDFKRMVYAGLNTKHANIIRPFILMAMFFLLSLRGRVVKVTLPQSRYQSLLRAQHVLSWTRTGIEGKVHTRESVTVANR